MKRRIEKLVSKEDQTLIEVLFVEPENEVLGVLQLVHGMAEHKERYLPLMEFCANAGYASVIHDHRGHGNSVESEEDLGYFKDDCACAIIKDTKQVNDFVKEVYPHQKIVLMGHSMGSLVVRNYMRQYDDSIQGLIVCGSPSNNPLLNIALTLVKLLIKIKGERYRSKFVDHLAFGNYHKNFTETSRNAWICGDNEVVEAYDKNPKCGFLFTLNGFLNLFLLMKKTYAKQGWQIRNRFAPILFIAGEEDPCIVSVDKFKEAAHFMCELGYEKVESKLYAKARHEILNEKCKNEVMHDVLQFMNKIMLTEKND